MPVSNARDGHVDTESLPSVDLLVPTRNRHDCLRRSLPTWLAAIGGAGRIILCDQSLQPFSVADEPRVQVLHCPKLSGLPAARNVLLATSGAEVVVFLDDDCEIAADFVAIIRCLARREPHLLAWGPVVERRGRWTRRLHRLAHLGAFHDPRRLVDGPCDQRSSALFGCCFAVRRTVAAQVGFDGRRAGYALGEDLDFFRRLARYHGSAHARFVRELRAVHRQDSADRADPYRRGVAKGAFLRWLARRHGQGNPATLFHLGAAVAAAASGQGQEPADWRGVLAGLLAP
ncbi:MAG TPA: glycosyltransferase [Planctomycetota bacterium]|nr:glycosyltransferase [Planctomycetota bacterium]